MESINARSYSHLTGCTDSCNARKAMLKRRARSTRACSYSWPISSTQPRQVGCSQWLRFARASMEMTLCRCGKKSCHSSECAFAAGALTCKSKLAAHLERFPPEGEDMSEGRQEGSSSSQGRGDACQKSLPARPQEDTIHDGDTDGPQEDAHERGVPSRCVLIRIAFEADIIL
eukprot:2026344-Prymnesium_polylepis.2